MRCGRRRKRPYCARFFSLFLPSKELETGPRNIRRCPEERDSGIVLHLRPEIDHIVDTGR